MDTMGQSFRAAREKKRVSLSQAALKTRIKVQHLEAMERDDFSRMPAPIYARGFIKSYSEFLGIDPRPLLEEYNQRHGGAKRPSLPADAKIIKHVPGEEPLPTGPAPVPEGGDAPDAGAGGASGRRAPFLDMRTLAIGGLAIGVLLLVVAAVKFWPAAPPREARRAEAIVEVGRPVAKSPLAVMREPPEPYLDIPGRGGRAP